MTDKHHFVHVDFHRFKAFRKFSLDLNRFNILVGPNNAGKSTILTAFRILAAALRKARARRPEIISSSEEDTFGYDINLDGVSVAEENIFYNYDDSETAFVRFRLSNRNELTLYFPERGTCYLVSKDSKIGIPRTPSVFRKHFNCTIGFVPILGPVEHNEPLYQEQAARLALFNYTAARNFRNIWHHYPEKFTLFREVLQETWPGMDIEAPTISLAGGKPVLHMFCPEERIPREIFWAGFGFQVWCQMLTHLIQSEEKSLFLIDEPDIYLHSDLQRQLLGLLRNLGPDILVATHSTEIITEAEANDIVLIDKRRQRGRRVECPSELAEVFVVLGSNLNPILTQLVKTRRVVFVEGKDFQIISKFSRKINRAQIASRSEFTVVPVGGFNPERIKSLKEGMQAALGEKIRVAAIFDRDYRSQAECDAVTRKCEQFCDLVFVHECKEIENFLLEPNAIDQAADRMLKDNNRRTNSDKKYEPCAERILESFASEVKNHVISRHLSIRRRFEKSNSPGQDEVNSDEVALSEFEQLWNEPSIRNKMVPGKEALSALNRSLQEKHGVSVTSTSIIDAMQIDNVPKGIINLIEALLSFVNAPMN